MAKNSEVRTKVVPLTVAETWNTFASRLVSAKLAWEEHRKLWQETSRIEIEKLPPEVQRFVSKSFNRSEFDVMLPRLVDFYRGCGGIEILVVKLNREEKK